MNTFTGQDLINAGYKPGPYFKDMLMECNRGGYINKDVLDRMLPPEPLKLKDKHKTPFGIFMDAETEDEQYNTDKVLDTMYELMKTPVLHDGAVMPDACPAGPVGTIPVGGVVSSEHIHPGMHSADVCCSVMISIYDNVSPKDMLDTVHKRTHFGWGGRGDIKMPLYLEKIIDENYFTSNFMELAHDHLGTQGDGNHFAYVGTLKSTGQTALVTHHGSRGFGAQVYRKAMSVAENYRKKLSPETLKQNAWIPHDTRDGEEYWKALQIIRKWTKYNHATIHGAGEYYDKLCNRFWNEHNFVFRKSDGLFYHGKGATPAFKGWAEDATDKTIIPLNMAEPILITEGLDNAGSLGFSPHGAGRNFSRSEHRRRDMGDFEEETKGLDIRFYSGNVDLTELPSGYKNAASVKNQIEKYKLAKVVDEVIPYGCIMAGDWEKDMPWRKKS